MTTQFDEWLEVLREGQKGPVTFPLASRGRVYVTQVALEGDWTDSVMEAEIRLYPDAGGSPLATFTVSGPVVDETHSTFTLSLTDAETTALPIDASLDGVVRFAVDVLLTPDGGDRDLLFGGTFQMAGRVTEGV